MANFGKTVLSSCPPWAQEAGRRVELMGFHFRFHEDYSLWDTGKHLQVRDDEELAPARTVKEYAEQMKAGDQFPPAILTADGYLVDGATREEAARRIGKSTFPAFILDEVFYENAPEPLQERLVTLAAMMNITHGNRLSDSSKMRVIEYIAQLKGADATPDDIARQLHISKSYVANILWAKKAQERAADLGVSLESARPLSMTHLARLGSAAGRINNEPWAALARLVVTGMLSTTEQLQITRRLNECDTDDQRMKLIEGESRSRHFVTQGVNRRPPLAAQLRQHLGFVLKNEPGQMVEVGSQGAGEDQYKLVVSAITMLQQVAARQNEFNRKQMQIPVPAFRS
jgi:hypothetical protein